MPERTVLVTGANGFVGRHLLRELADAGHRVVAVGQDAAPALPDLVADYASIDLTGTWRDVPPADAVVHLAGLSAVGPSFDAPQSYLDVNGSMINRLARWAGALASPPRILVVSSGAVYDATSAQPLTEDSPTSCSSPYVVSKLLVENLASYYRDRGLDVAVARPFNHIGPGQGAGFLVPDLARQLLGSSVGGGSVRVGDLGTARDYTDVRDVVRAYRLLLTADLQGEWLFNVSSGRSLTGRDLLTRLAAAMRVEDPAVEVDRSRLRPQDARDIRGAAGRLQRVTGWSPELAIERTLADVVAELMDQVEQ